MSEKQVLNKFCIKIWSFIAFCYCPRAFLFTLFICSVQHSVWLVDNTSFYNNQDCNISLGPFLVRNILLQPSTASLIQNSSPLSTYSNTLVLGKQFVLRTFKLVHNVILWIIYIVCRWVPTFQRSTVTPFSGLLRQHVLWNVHRHLPAT